MGAYVLRRLLALIPVLLGVSFLTFAITQVTPGDPVVLMLGNYATPERVLELRQQLGLNDPFFVQFGRYVWNAVHGNLGLSIRGQTPVAQEILQRFPSTLQLTLAAVLFCWVAGIGLGLIAGTARRKIVDSSTMVLALTGLSVPSFWLAIILIILFGIKLKWVSVTGGSGLKDLILPAFCLGLAPAAVLARLTRSCMLEVMREDYVRTARAKGLGERLIMVRHVLRNAMIPVITVMGLQFGGMLGGAVFIESVFARPGIGRFAINAISARDYPQIQGMVLFTASLYVLINLAVDMAYGFLDPRIRFD
jgi:peptide/nickel transport system permease protein